VIFIALPLLIWYPITRKSHLKLLAELEVKRAQKANSGE